MDQLTLYIVSTIVLLVIGYLYLRVFARRDYLEKGRLSPANTVFKIIYFCTLGGWVPYIYLERDWPEVHLNSGLEAVGLIVLWVGVFLLFSGATNLGWIRAMGRDSRELKQSGYYRYSRNPQIAGCILYAIAFVVLWPSWYAIGWLVLLLVILQIMILTEEEHLGKVFGDDYERYCERVPRYVRLKWWK